jgi:hypothetical protein
MDGNNHIDRFREYSPIEELFTRDTFSRAVDDAYAQLLTLFRCASSFARNLSEPSEFLGGITSKGDGMPALPRALCLGETVELVARKGCEFFRDRFIALTAFRRSAETWLPTISLPRPEAEACAYVWWATSHLYHCSRVSACRDPTQLLRQALRLGYLGIPD